MGGRYGITEKTARLFMLKIREAMSSSENHPMEGIVNVDEFIFGAGKKVRLGRVTAPRKRRPLLVLSLPKKVK